MPITALPTPPSRADSVNFATRADAFFAALPAFVAEFNALVPAAVAGAVTGSFSVTQNCNFGSASTNTVLVNGKLGIGAPPTAMNLEVTGSAARINRATNTYADGMILEATAATALGHLSTALVFSGNNSNAAIWSQRLTGFGGALVLATQSTGGGNPVERARVDENGSMLVGYTTSNGVYKLQVNSQIFATSSTVATSDGRYKKNITTLTGALAVVNGLRPVSFAWKPHAVHSFQEGRQIGFIAQEMKTALAATGYGDAIVKKNTTVLPDGTDESFLGIAEGNLIAVLVAAVQELTARVATLEARP